MSRGKEEEAFLGTLMSGALFKRSQGRLTRQLTAVALSAIVLIGCWTLSNTALSESEHRWVQLGVPTLIAATGMWVVYRLVNFPRFANFLISVEAEMDKVSWANAEYLKRATFVVIGTMLTLGAVLWVYDFVWLKLFSFLQILDLEALRPRS